MRILSKWYFNELPAYLIMPFPEIANDKNKPECIFSYLKKFVMYILLPNKNKRFYLLSSNYLILTK